MKTVVVYKSKSGFTKNYAEWIAEELSADIYTAKEIDIEKIKTYDNIIYGGGLYAGGINGVKIITKNIEQLRDKKLVVFTTGASPKRDETTKEIRDKNFSEEELKTIKFFYLRGGYDNNKVKSIDKIAMKMLYYSLNKKKDLTADERGMLNAYDTPVDFTRKKNIEELINYIKKS